MNSLLGKHWHHLPAAEVLDLLDTDVRQGLDLFEVKHRQERFGLNVLTPRKGKSPFLRFLQQFNNPLVIILLVASVVTAILKDPMDALVIFGVVLINAIIGYIQEARAEQAIAALAQTMTTEAVALRGQQVVRLPAAELVPGDIVQLQAGARVPADLRLVSSRDLQVTEAALTGESVPVEKDASLLVAHDAVLADRRNMVYASTLVTYGAAAGVVVATGDGSEIGRISQLIASATELETPLTRKIGQFSRVLLVAILILSALTFGIGILRGQPAVDTLMAAIALAVGAIPEGLPAALTVTLAIGVSRMARRRAIIRNLPAVETSRIDNGYLLGQDRHADPEPDDGAGDPHFGRDIPGQWCWLPARREHLWQPRPGPRRPRGFESGLIVQRQPARRSGWTLVSPGRPDRRGAFGIRP